MVSLIRRILVLISIENNNNGWFVSYISINEYEGTYKYGNDYVTKKKCIQ